jgi:hypothetical protein
MSFMQRAFPFVGPAPAAAPRREPWRAALRRTVALFEERAERDRRAYNDRLARMQQIHDAEMAAVRREASDLRFRVQELERGIGLADIERRPVIRRGAVP